MEDSKPSTSSLQTFNINDFHLQDLKNKFFYPSYLGTHLQTSQQYLIIQYKKAQITRLSDIKSYAYFLSNLAHLSHPNLVTPLAIHQSKSEISVFYEVIHPFEEKYPEFPAEGIPTKVSKKLGFQLASVLGYLHSQGVFHSLVSILNLYLDGKGDLKLILSPRNHNYKRQEKMKYIPANPSICPPEVLTGEYDPLKVEVFSFGVAFFKLLTGQGPYLSSGMRRPCNFMLISETTTYSSPNPWMKKQLTSSGTFYSENRLGDLISKRLSNTPFLTLNDRRRNQRKKNSRSLIKS